MKFRRLVLGLIVAGILLLIVACGDTSSKTPVSPTQSPTPSEPALTVGATPEPPIATLEALSSTETPGPTAQPGQDTPTPRQPVVDLQGANSLVFFDEGGITLEYYWPLDSARNLSAEETEILAYNTSATPSSSGRRR